MLCSNAARSVDDFFEYDFVGAPIAPHLGAGMNGGLSLRKRETILRILDEFNWEENKGSRFEDRWYFDRYVTLCFLMDLPQIQTSNAHSYFKQNERPPRSRRRRRRATRGL
jgi:hypothetical protein